MIASAQGTGRTSALPEAVDRLHRITGRRTASGHHLLPSRRGERLEQSDLFERRVLEFIHQQALNGGSRADKAPARRPVPAMPVAHAPGCLHQSWEVHFSGFTKHYLELSRGRAQHFKQRLGYPIATVELRRRQPPQFLQLLAQRSARSAVAQSALPAELACGRGRISAFASRPLAPVRSAW